MRGHVSLPGEGQLLDAIGCRIRIRIPSEATDGRASAIEMEAPGGFTAPPLRHRHLDLDWQGHVLEGTVAMELDGQLVTIPGGGIVTVPRGVAFKWWNASADRPVRWVCSYFPGGFERYFVELVTALGGLGRPPSRDDLATLVPPLWKKYGIEAIPTI
jgi:mannose-6-phosphate isomerase-like protein (cupin superfamily)